ncbi:hypothetical protein P885DRAFT_43990, partial [Corynascus similis CBS 632.67]
MVCDYTGLQLSWAGGTSGRSFESLYNFAIADGSVVYHSPPNFGFTMASLNWLKRSHPILVLPLIGRFLRTHDEPMADFETRKATWTFVYIALLNVGITSKLLHCNKGHTDQVKLWGQWPLEDQKAMLEHIRTGAMDCQLDSVLLPDVQARSNKREIAHWGQGKWKGVYHWLVKIAEKHGLTSGEFEEYCTVRAPGTSTQNRRVFYPYHCLSKEQAEGMSWDWHSLYAVVSRMLDTMRRYCNRHAEAAGYGEQKMTPLNVIYWWAHHLCKKIQAVKQQRPVVPWSGNILRASLCKYQDHNIAMRFGLCLPKNGEDFDPVEHWDDFSCTVTIDSQATNMAMKDYAVSSWDSIRRAISSVPWRHPYWRVNPLLDERCWVGTWHTGQVTARPIPEPTPSIPLVPIDHWLDATAPLPIFQCAECPFTRNFQTAGILVRHYQ